MNFAEKINRKNYATERLLRIIMRIKITQLQMTIGEKEYGLVEEKAANNAIQKFRKLVSEKS